MDTTQMSFNSWVHKQIAVYPYNWIPFGNKKKQAMDTPNNMAESQNNYTEWKSQTK